jgi:hypothetical protein
MQLRHWVEPERVALSVGIDKGGLARESWLANARETATTRAGQKRADTVWPGADGRRQGVARSNRPPALIEGRGQAGTAPLKWDNNFGIKLQDRGRSWVTGAAEAGDTSSALMAGRLYQVPRHAAPGATPDLLIETRLGGVGAHWRLF